MHEQDFLNYFDDLISSISYEEFEFNTKVNDFIKEYESRQWESFYDL